MGTAFKRRCKCCSKVCVQKTAFRCNAEALKKFYGRIDRSQWQKIVDRYYLEELKFFSKDELDIDSIFRKDYWCWAADKEKTWLFIENGEITYKCGRTEEEALAQESLSV